MRFTVCTDLLKSCDIQSSEDLAYPFKHSIQNWIGELKKRNRMRYSKILAALTSASGSLNCLHSLTRRCEQTFALTLMLVIALFLGSCAPTTTQPENQGNPEGVLDTNQQETTLEGLSAPELIRDAEESWVYGESANLKWESVPGAESYTFELSSKMTFDTVVLTHQLTSADESDGIFEKSFDPPFQAGETFFIRIRSEGQETEGQERLVSNWSISEHTLILATPIVLTPSEETGPLKEPRPQFEWDPVPGASRYTFVVKTAGAEGEPVKSIFTTDVDQTSLRLEEPLPSPGVYKVEITGHNGEEVQSEMTERTFRFAPPVPSIMSPSSGARLVSERPRIKWQFTEATLEENIANTSFTVEISTFDESGQNINPVNKLVVGNLYIPETTGIFTRGNKYRLRVKSEDQQFWSPAVEFEILEEPAEIYPLSKVLAREGQNEARFALSNDGQYLAVASLPQDSIESNVAWNLSFFRKEVEPGTSGKGEFKLLPDAKLREDSQKLLLAHDIDLAWAPAGKGDPTLFISCTRDQFVGAFGGSIYKHVLWSSKLESVLPANMNIAVNSLAFSLNSDPQTLFFERRWEPQYTSAEQNEKIKARLGFEAQGQKALICSVRTDGTEFRTHRIGSYPAVSPKGDHVAFVSNSLGGAKVFIMNIATQEIEQLPISLDSDDQIRGLAWCPHGDHLAFSRKIARSDTGYDVVLYDIKKKEEEILTKSFADDLDPTFVPSSRLDLDFEGIIFCSNRSGESWDVFRLDVEK